MGRSSQHRRGTLHGFGGGRRGSGGPRDLAPQVPGQGPGDAVRRDFARQRDQGDAVGTGFTVNAGARAFGGIVEDVAELRFDQGALFLDDDDFIKARGEVTDGFAYHRPDEARFQ